LAQSTIAVGTLPSHKDAKVATRFGGRFARAADAINAIDDAMTDVTFDESDVRLIIDYVSKQASPAGDRLRRGSRTRTKP
jgi:hypothetical protein